MNNQINRKPLILAIDTSCDDTSVAVLQGRNILSNVVSSQVELHKKWGGVMPTVAKLAHIENIEPCYKEALKRAGKNIEDIEYIAVTFGPGLAIALEVGLQFAKDICKKYDIPLVAINHMEGHLLSSLSLNSAGNGNVSDEELPFLFPALGIIVSGKNTELVIVKDFCEYEQIGWTLDDAAGECFDKVGRMLNLGYPGGPVISELAKEGSDKLMEKIHLPIPLKNTKDYNFSFSGLKTACLYGIEKLRAQCASDNEWVNDFCFAFVETVVRTIENKTERALKNYPEIRTIIIGGGVINNEKLCIRLGLLAKKYGKAHYVPDVTLRSDNGAMIGVATFFNILKGHVLKNKQIEKIDRDPVVEI